ncbi:metallophosphoesterase [Pendulispora albinea]|uniref:Metallophosphoesterase n=1 Tax=Pendulispora albinea TaxID=2741071 RepID=A0ABZ2LVP2_9BACT
MSEDKPRARVRIAAVGDLHCRKTSMHSISPLLESVNERADVLVLCGDLTDHGTSEEAHILAKELAGVRIPKVGVLGNHDYETGQPEEVTKILEQAGIEILDGEAVEICGVGFAGAKGFIGGFGRGTLGAWGESAIKRIVQEAIDEALKLESALSRLRTERRVAILHYAPVRDTVEGEPVEIFPYLGCGRLAEPLNRYPVDALFHGHAHHGCPEGRTNTGVPVYNVALPLLRTLPESPTYRLLTLGA